MDAHTDIVIEKLHKRGLDFFRWNIEDFLTEHGFEIEIENGCVKNLMLSAEDRNIDLVKDVSVVWYRRPGKLVISEAVKDEGYIEFGLREAKFLLNNVWRLLEDKTWINNPFENSQIDNKLYQLSLAAKLGLETPHSFVTNKKKEAYNFIEKYGDVVVKAISVGHVNQERGFKNIYTHKIEADDLSKLDSVELAPTLFQLNVPKQIELRITVIEDSVFSCAIESQKSEKSKQDWRRYDFENVPHYPYEVPEEIEQKLIEFLRVSGLKYGAFDMVLTPDDRYVFLELNPNGQWYWIEHLTGLKITDKLIDLFAKYL